MPDPHDQPGPSGGTVAQPHDALFRFVFGKPVHAASELRAVLPAALAERLDLAGLRLVNGSFVDEELTNRHCDVLMRTTLDGRDAYVYVLIEHQSSADPMMPLRMLRYVMRIWERHLEQHPKARRLPMIVPLVVYQGSRRWAHPVELSELLDLDPETARLAGAFLPRFRFLLDDLTTLDKTALRARPVSTPVRLTVRLLRIVPTHASDAVAAIDPDDIDDLRDLLRYPDWRELITALLKYIQAASETPPHRLAWLAAQIGPEAEEVYMTTADILRAEGEAKGRAEGEAKGRVEHAARMLVRLLTRRFGAVPEDAHARIDAASLEQLDIWSERVLDAAALEDVFR
ncbi:Rpn family recombination-promoting nuclease/putative transposase [Pseudonocardia sp. DSM 110487]|uniref:Rpn family recombination-promoting nuclease/putative transposase n=1 Tax=Pseudonocardia sp. DSM 110487 TaxID=2865833 RepID=UPI001C69D842|nr:Rpn family recombination-promoting nuclease/putative transposase [Pseudonocardia sp. DSM 110487]QYN35379.1 Rpn family recombination-promoting nuclease/putative transposase [Pseudonocardia sp. DSM 110487]